MLNAACKNIIEINNLTKVYPRGGRGIKNASFEVKTSDFIALLGRNGAGKSTLIYCLVGALKPTSGSVKHNLHDASNLAWVNQSFSIDWLLSVEDNVRLGARLGGASFSQAQKITYDALKNVDLYSQRRKMPELLSGGQQKRLQVARALAQEPKCFLLDEPTTGLDLPSTESFFSHLSTLTKKGIACIVATHELDIIEKHATRAIFLDNGEIAADLPIKDFIHKYGSLKKAFENAI